MEYIAIVVEEWRKSETTADEAIEKIGKSVVAWIQLKKDDEFNHDS